MTVGKLMLFKKKKKILANTETRKAKFNRSSVSSQLTKTLHASFLTRHVVVNTHLSG